MKNDVSNPSKSFLALKKVNARILSTLKDHSLKKIGKTPSSHIIHSLGGEYCWIVRDSEPIRLLKSPRSLSVYILISHGSLHPTFDCLLSFFFEIFWNRRSRRLISEYSSWDQNRFRIIEFRSSPIGQNYSLGSKTSFTNCLLFYFIHSFRLRMIYTNKFILRAFFSCILLTN